MDQIVPQPKKLRILIADDVQETRRNTRIMLAELDNVEVVAIASNGRQAVEMTEEQNPDIVILDVFMPEMDGLTAYQHILQTRPQTSCIIISGENDAQTVEAAESIGVQEYLLKPFTIEQLESAIKNINEERLKNRPKIKPPNTADLNNKDYLERLAGQYLKEGRTDDVATKVFENLAKNPDCNKRWLETLAMIYAIRREWGKLKLLSARLEQLK